MKKIIFAALIVAQTGCGILFPDILVAGSAEGYNALADGANAMITNTKSTDPMGDSAAWQHRKQQEQEITKRKCAKCGFFGKLIGTSESTGSKY
jgi:hypothetical protein